MRSFKALGLLLAYPVGDLASVSEGAISVLRDEGLLEPRLVDGLEEFLSRRAERDPLTVQEVYVETFDRGRAHCLHLFEHLYGESRDRGTAMVELADRYAEKGLYIEGNELPDYLPLFMEFLSECPLEEARGLLGEVIEVIGAIRVKLEKRGSPYAAVFKGIEALSGVTPDPAAVKKSIERTAEDPKTLEGLDQEWMEAEAFGGDPLREVAADCGGCGIFFDPARTINKTVGGS